MKHAMRRQRAMRRPIALSQTALTAVLTTIMTRLWHSILYSTCSYHSDTSALRVLYDWWTWRAYD